YDLDKTEIVARPGGTLYSVSCNEDGEVFTSCNAEIFKWRPANDPYRAALTAWGKDGKKRWSWPTDMDVGQWKNINGETILGPFKAPGETGEVFGLTAWHGVHVPLITTDGLLVDRLLRDPAEGGEPGPDMYRSETIQCISRLEDGRLILSQGANAHHLLEITGLENVRRFAGGFTLSAEQSKQAEQFLSRSKTKLAENAPVRLLPLKENETVAVDGKLDEWDWKTAVSIGPKEAASRAEVALRFEGARLDKTTGKWGIDTLCFAYKVFKNGPFINKGDNPNELFIGGDAVDFQFCADPVADPKRKEPAMGDCRLLISKFGDKPVAVLYRTKAPGAKKPVSFRNPAGTEVVFDEVLEIKDAKIAITDTPEGYVVEAAVPLNTLFNPAPGQPTLWKGRVIQGDVGIIVANAASLRIARIYRFNKDTQLVADLPTEARLMPANWGEIEVE
ncbi:MAG: hypothetical protein WAX69_02900, partial [Victivallales bacterium]